MVSGVPVANAGAGLQGQGSPRSQSEQTLLGALISRLTAACWQFSSRSFSATVSATETLSSFSLPPLFFPFHAKYHFSFRTSPLPFFSLAGIHALPSLSYFSTPEFLSFFFFRLYNFFSSLLLVSSRLSTNGLGRVSRLEEQRIRATFWQHTAPATYFPATRFPTPTHPNEDRPFLRNPGYERLSGRHAGNPEESSLEG